MRSTLRIVLCLLASFAVLAHAQDAQAPSTDPLLFAIEIRTGPKWDAARPASEQAHFREHSANLRKLRDAGNLVVGARYSDKGLVILSAASLADARAMMDADPSIAAGVFAYEAHPFNVFYPGTLQPRVRR